MTSPMNPFQSVFQSFQSVFQQPKSEKMMKIRALKVICVLLLNFIELILGHLSAGVRDNQDQKNKSKFDKLNRN